MPYKMCCAVYPVAEVGSVSVLVSIPGPIQRPYRFL
jgi:hypothetical protein